ncbi:MAG: hypothetical protein K8J31_03765 [Anaerolineae bacterium]|nr:hypothetical protein [Anaerolineae bacterium]
MRIADRFDDGLHPDWRVTRIGQAEVQAQPGALRLSNFPTPAGRYSDAQISDYRASDFRWRPPLRLTVRAQVSTSLDTLRGTAGFGFWNQPFMPGEFRLRLPQAIWFFFSAPPANIQLAQDVPGPGWKAATLNARRWQFLALLPAAPLGFLLMRAPLLYRRLWPIGQRALGVSEHLLDPTLLGEVHTYMLDWHPDGAAFHVDDRLMHAAPAAPGGPLGFIAWIDNQYAIVTPQGHFGAGVVPLDQPQTLRLESVTIETL